MRDLVRDRLATPLGADFQIGLSTKDLHRVSDVIVPVFDVDPSVLDRGSAAYRTFTGPAFSAGAANTADWRAADLGAANGHGNAASVADVLSPLVTGSGAGPSLRPDTVDLIFREQSNGVDLVNGLHVRWGIGFALPDRRTLPWLPGGRIAFWGGWGGSMAIADIDRRMTISYVMNRMDADLLGSSRAAAYVGAVYDVVRGSR
ncbi:serine hydrolase [Pseudonocardia xinjiangensis]|uniref:serine hydrolase n=1 Tax=Pseudonocardia xinjiangensis TaxID=75289 RepID=UPI001B7D27AE|nr:serine hydrolase [Pseudonocardia xinjiangensis]